MLGVLLAWRLRLALPLLVIACLGVVWFVMGFTSIMACPHCGELLWGLSHKISKLRYCPFCGRELDE